LIRASKISLRVRRKEGRMRMIGMNGRILRRKRISLRSSKRGKLL
jgi:hypothetical protein